MALKDFLVSVAVRNDDESKVRHRNVQRDNCRLISAVRTRRGRKGTSRFSVQFTLEPQTPKAVYKCLQLRRRIAKPCRCAKYDAIGPLCVGRSRGSVFGKHSFAALLPARYFGHNLWRNDIGHAA